MHLSTRFTVAVIAALAACLATGCSGSSNPAPSPSSRAEAVRAAGSAEARGLIPASVPGHYVTLDDAHPGRLLVRGTVTGAVTATVSAPAHFLFTAVYGTGTGRVFIIDGYPNPPTAAGGDHLYLLRLNSGGRPLPLVPVHAGHAVGPGLSALALSPDASKIAIAYMGLTSPPTQQPLIVYSVKTGAMLHTWTTASGIISGTDPMGGSDAGPGTALRWTADGKELAFAFYANAKPGKNGYGYQQSASIRLLNTTAPGSSLLADSKVLTGPGPGYTPAYGTGMQCLAQDGWSISANGEALTCATQWGTPGEQLPAGLRSAQCPAKTGAGQVNLGFLRQYWLPSGGGGGGPVYRPCTADTPADIQLDWANSDATLVLGGLKLPGHSLFGLFSGGKLIALPAPPAGLSATSTAW